MQDEEAIDLQQHFDNGEQAGHLEPQAETKFQPDDLGFDPMETEVTIRFNIQPEGFPHEMVFFLGTGVTTAKKDVGADLQIPAENMRLIYQDTEMLDDLTLAECGLRPGTIEMIDLYVDYGGGDSVGYRMPDILEVEVHFDDPDIPPKRIQVRVEREGKRKLYLGGFRHRKTGLIYHHAGSQTDFERRSRWEGLAERFHRETQTVFETTRSQQTTREGGTQMARPDLYIDDEGEREMTSRAYFSAAALEELQLQMCINIQCHWRGYKARSRAQQLRTEQRQRREQVAEEEKKRYEEAEAAHQREIRRRMHPRTGKDFEILYNELESWRNHETARINGSQLDERERLAALAQLLHKETKLLQTIDRLKLSANAENKEARIKQMLKLMAAPKKWQMRDGDTAEVHTPFTTRAKELLELFNGLKLPLLTVDERLDVLLHVKWTVKEFDCNLTREIVDLVDREADLLNRGRSEKSLSGLRRRISNLFLQFIETPEFNPEATRFQKVPRDMTSRPNIKPITGLRR